MVPTARFTSSMYRGIIQHRIYVTTYLRKQIEERGLEQPRGMGASGALRPTAPRRRISNQSGARQQRRTLSPR